MSKKINIIAEIANAHQGDPENALELARAAVKSGADSVKFQIYFSDEFMTVSHPRYEHFKNQSFEPKTWDSVLRETKKLGVEVYADVFGVRALEIAIENEIDGVKVHSSDLVNTRLLDELAYFDKKIFLATGGSALIEIRYALDHLEVYDKPSEIILMHGFQAYPTKIEDSKLLRIKEIGSLFPDDLSLGYMDHVDAADPFSLVLPLLTIPYGVKYIEKHITFLRSNKGVDYYSSLEPREFVKFVEYVRMCENAIGENPLSFSESERNYRKTVKKNWTSTKPLRAGEIIKKTDLVMKRTPSFVAPPLFEEIAGKKLVDRMPFEGVVNKDSVEHKVLAIIVARTRSSRFPNKALAHICDEPTICHLIKRVLRAYEKGYVDNIAFCTTTDASDDKLADLAASFPVSVFRGSVDDVLARMMLAIKDFQDHDVVLRITGDDILIDADYLNKTVIHHLQTNSHYTDAKKLPSGTEVEVFDSRVLQIIYELSNDSSGTEYLTNYVLDSQDQFNMSTLPVCPSHQSDYRLTIDTPEDFNVVSKLLSWFKEKGVQYSYSVEDIIGYLDSHPHVASLNQNTAQRSMPIDIDSSLSWRVLTANPLVTVYITNYNYAKYIRQSIDSVLNQRSKNVELIIIDDGSTDSSRSIIQEYAGNIKVKIIFQDNKGLNTTNNIALNLARGKYIMRLDADDYLDENAILLLSDKMENDPELAMVFPDYYMVNEDGEIISHEYRHNFGNAVSLYDQPAHGACSMVRREVLLEVGGYSEEFQCQDGYELWVKLIGRYKIDNINLPLFYYRQHANSLTSNNDKILKTRCDIIQKHTQNEICEKHQNLCIIPIRADGNENPLALRSFSGSTLLDITIDQALHAKNIDSVILTTNDERIYAYAKKTLDEKIIVDKRPTSLATLNVPIEKTVNYLLKKYYGELDLPETITILNYEYPLRSSKYIDNSIDVICLYDADSALSVSKRSRNLYRHEGNGLIPFSSNTQLRLERNAVYEEQGGIHSFRYKSFCENGQLMSGKVTHILLDDISCKMVQSEVDFEIAQYLYQKRIKAGSNV